MRAVILAVGFALSLPWPAGSDASLAIRVTPAVTMAPGLLTIRTTIAANPDNRAVEVVADSPTFFRSSQITLDGERAPRVNNFVFRSLPAGLY